MPEDRYYILSIEDVRGYGDPEGYTLEEATEAINSMGDEDPQTYMVIKGHRVDRVALTDPFDGDA